MMPKEMNVIKFDWDWFFVWKRNSFRFKSIRSFEFILKVFLNKLKIVWFKNKFKVWHFWFLKAKENERSREYLGKTIRLLFDSAKIKPNPKSLIDSLENLIIEKTFPFSLIDPVHLKKIDELIELCLKWNVKPELDYSREELKLIGDRQSCSLCFYLLKPVRQAIIAL